MTLTLLFYFLFLCCFSFGVAFFVIDSIYSEKFFQPVLSRVVRFLKWNLIKETYDKAMICYGCIGFWGGILFSSIFEVRGLPISRFFFILISGFMASGFSLFCNYFASYLLLQFQKKKEQV